MVYRHFVIFFDESFRQKWRNKGEIKFTSKYLFVFGRVWIDFYKQLTPYSTVSSILYFRKLYGISPKN